VSVRQTTVGEFLKETGGSIKTGPFGTKLKASEYTPDGVPVISVGEVGFGRLRLHEKTPRVDESVWHRMPEFILRTGDIVFGRKGAVERSAQVMPDEDGFFLGSDGIRIRLNNEQCDPRFFAYQFLTSSHRTWMVQHAAGSTMPSLNEGIIGRIPIIVPPLAEQKRIARILGTLDDKIELNRRMNATLEAMARALFQSWFVDFDPVRRNAEGGESRPEDALFPDSFDDSTVGEIPLGWTIERVGDVVDCVGGGTPSTKEPKFWDDGVHHWTTPKDFSSLQSPILIDTSRKLTDAGIAKISSGLLPAGTLLLSSRAPVGYLAISAIDVAINQGFIAMKCNDRASKYFMLNWCQSNMGEIKSRATGTTFPEISKNSFRPISVVLPSKGPMAEFTAKVEPLYEQITANLHQSATLTTIRNELLPKMLSGTLKFACH
jgi:type I restriction enzyme, S subunit